MECVLVQLAKQAHNREENHQSSVKNSINGVFFSFCAVSDLKGFSCSQKPAGKQSSGPVASFTAVDPYLGFVISGVRDERTG